MPRQRPQRRSSSLRARVAVFAVLALALAGAAAYAVWPRDLASADAGPVDLTVRVDMGGFTPATLTLPADRSARVRLVNPDTSMHSDGGGIHQFAVPKLGIDVKIQPESTQVVTVPPTAAGEYAFYCDTCCGGKDNPSMQGVLKITS